MKITEQDLCDIRFIVEIFRERDDIARELDLVRKVERLEALGAKIEFCLRVVPALGDRYTAITIESINNDLEKTANLVAQLYGEDDEGRATI